jgi:hypothetical protein
MKLAATASNSLCLRRLRLMLSVTAATEFAKVSAHNRLAPHAFRARIISKSKHRIPSLQQKDGHESKK